MMDMLDEGRGQAMAQGRGAGVFKTPRVDKLLNAEEMLHI